MPRASAERRAYLPLHGNGTGNSFVISCVRHFFRLLPLLLSLLQQEQQRREKISFHPLLTSFSLNPN